MQSMAEQLAENYHNTWGRKKKLELQSKGVTADVFFTYILLIIILLGLQFHVCGRWRHPPPAGAV